MSGGIIALALVMSGDSTESMIKFFLKAAKATFGKSRTFSNKATRALMVLGRYDSQYSSEPLEKELSTFFGENTSLAREVEEFSKHSPCCGDHSAR